MAGRIRSLKPEMLEDDHTAQLDDEDFRAFVSMMLLADDYGNLRANPRYLSASIFWGTESPNRDWAKIKRNLAHLVHWWSKDGQDYAHIKGWAKHQRVDKPGKPRVPHPPNLDEIENSRDSREPPEKVTGTPGTEDDLRRRSPKTISEDEDERASTPPTESSPSAPPPAPAAPEKPALTERDMIIREGLALAEDLFVGCDIDAAAVRIRRALSMDPRSDKLDLRVLAAEAAKYARSWSLRFPLAEPAQRLAEAERKAGWLVSSMSKPAMPQQRPQTSGGRFQQPTPQEVDREILADVAESAKKLEREQEERARKAKNREPAPDPATMAKEARKALERFKRPEAS